MARTTITLPDDVLVRAREVGLDISGVAAAALQETLDRREKTAALDAALAQRDDVLGPLTAEEMAAANAWADDFERQLGSRTPGSTAR